MIDHVSGEFSGQFLDLDILLRDGVEKFIRCVLKGILQQHLDLHEIVLELVDSLHEVLLILVNEHVPLGGVLLQLLNHVLLEAVELCYGMDALLLGLKLRLSEHLLAVRDVPNLFFGDALDIGLILLDELLYRLLEGRVALVVLRQVLQLLRVLVHFSLDGLQHLLGAVNLGINQVLVDRLLILFSVRILVFIRELFTVLRFGISPLLVVDQFIIQVLQALQTLDGVQLVVKLCTLCLLEGVLSHFEHLELVLL